MVCVMEKSRDDENLVRWMLREGFFEEVRFKVSLKKLEEVNFLIIRRVNKLRVDVEEGKFFFLNF